MHDIRIAEYPSIWQKKYFQNLVETSNEYVSLDDGAK